MPLKIQANSVKAPPSNTRHKFNFISIINKLRTPKIHSKDRLLFTEHLALALETGTNLHEGLQGLKKQIKNPTMRAVIENIIDLVSQGKPFSVALSAHPEVFSKTYVNLIAASENGGFMHDVLNKLYELDERHEEMMGQLSSTFSYPIFLAIFSVGVVVFILVKVFPNFTEMFAPIYDQLPITTRVLMSASKVLTEHLSVFIGTSLFFLITLNQWLKRDSFRLLLDRLKLELPLVKDVVSRIYIAQIMRVIGLSLSHGVSVIDALRSAKETVENHLFSRMIDKTIATLESGNTLTQGFEKSPLIPDLVTQMVSTGEQSGTLATVMLRIGEHYEKEFIKHLRTFSKLLEPAMLVIMGVLVGVIVSSLILPIFKLSAAAH